MTATLVLLSLALSGFEALKGLRWGLAPLMMAAFVFGIWIYPGVAPWNFPQLGMTAVLGTVALFHSARNRSIAECLLPTLMFLAVASPSPSALGITLFLSALTFGLHQLETKGDIESGPLALRLTLSLCVLVGGTGDLSPSLEIGLNVVAVLWILTVPQTPHFAFVFGVQGLVISLLLPESKESVLLLTSVGFCGALLGARNLFIHFKDRQKASSLLSMVFSWFLVLKAGGLMDWVIAGLCTVVGVLLSLRGLQWTYGSHSPDHWMGAKSRAFGFWALLQGTAFGLIAILGMATGLTPDFGWLFKVVSGLVLSVVALALGTLSWVPSGKPAKTIGKPGFFILVLAMFFLCVGLALVVTTPLPLSFQPYWLVNVFGIAFLGFCLGKAHLIPIPSRQREQISPYRSLLVLGATVERIERLVVDRLFLDRSAGFLLWTADRVSGALSDYRVVPWVIFALLMVAGTLLFGGEWG